MVMVENNVEQGGVRVWNESNKNVTLERIGKPLRYSLFMVILLEIQFFFSLVFYSIGSSWTCWKATMMMGIVQDIIKISHMLPSK